VPNRSVDITYQTSALAQVIHWVAWKPAPRPVEIFTATAGLGATDVPAVANQQTRTHAGKSM
jgi:hypothetical protein